MSTEKRKVIKKETEQKIKEGFSIAMIQLEEYLEEKNPDLISNINVNNYIGFILLYLYYETKDELGDINKIIEIILNIPKVSRFVKNFLESEEGKKIIKEIESDKILYEKIKRLSCYFTKTHDSGSNLANRIYSLFFILNRIIDNAKKSITYLKKFQSLSNIKKLYTIMENDSDINEFYKEAIEELIKSARELHDHNYNNDEIKEILRPVINSMFLFLLKEEDISNFIDLLLTSDVTNILNYLEKQYLNKKYFEIYLKESLDNLNDINAGVIISNIFIVIKILLLVDDLNENPRDYLNKIVNYLKIAVSKLINSVKTEILVKEKGDENTANIKLLLLFIGFVIDGITNSTLLKLIKYCSLKQQKDINDVLEDIINQFKEMAEPYFNTFNKYIELDLPLEYRKTMKDIFYIMVKEKGYSEILEKDIKRIEILNDFDFNKSTLSKVLEEIGNYLTYNNNI